MKYDRWTEEETKLARENYHLGPDEFLQKVGRTKQGARAHLKYERVREKKNAGKVELRRRQKQIIERPCVVVSFNRPPDHVIADAIKRANAPRSLTAWICGDPAPGQSALERRA